MVKANSRAIAGESCAVATLPTDDPLTNTSVIAWLPSPWPRWVAVMVSVVGDVAVVVGGAVVVVGA